MGSHLTTSYLQVWTVQTIFIMECTALCLKNLCNCALTSNERNSSQSFQKGCSWDIILKFTSVKFSISFLNWLINFSLTFWGLLPKLWISVGILITVTRIFSIISGNDSLGSPCPLAKMSKWTTFIPENFFLFVCVFCQPYWERLSLIPVAPNQSWKMSSQRFLRASCLPEWSTCCSRRWWIQV